MVDTAVKQETNIVSMDQYPQQQYNVLVPTTYVKQISPFHQIRVEEVKINPNPNDGDVFKIGSKKAGNEWHDVLSLSKTGLLKLSNAAGIVWNWKETKVLNASRDYVLYQAVGAIRKPSGEWIPLKASKEIDLDVIRDELVEQFKKKANDNIGYELSKQYKAEKKKYRASRYDKEDSDGYFLDESEKPRYIDDMVHSNLIQWRKNKLARAETGAMLRVIRALLNLRHQYDQKELAKPFIVPHVDFAPDYNDPQVRAMIVENGLKATTELFGSAGQGLSAAQSMQQMIGSANEAFSEPPCYDDGMVEEEPCQQDNSVTDIENNASDEPPIIEAEPVITVEPSDPVCTECSVKITERVAKYSVEKFGCMLCYNCQKKVSK